MRSVSKADEQPLLATVSAPLRTGLTRIAAALRRRSARRARLRELKALLRWEAHVLRDAGVTRDDVLAAIDAAHLGALPADGPSRHSPR